MGSLLVGRTVHGALLALVLIMLSAFVPRTTVQRTSSLRRADLTVRPLEGPAAQRYINDRVRAHLDRARKDGFLVYESEVFVGGFNRAASLSDWLVGAQADTFNDNDGVLVFTVLDDGDYSTVEYSVYYYDHGGTYEFWGNQQVNLSTRQTSEWGYGLWSSYPSARNEHLLEQLCNLASPAVSAQSGPIARWRGTACTDAGGIFRGVLSRAGLWAAGGVATAVGPCIGATVGWGACVVSAATGGFVWGIIYEGYEAGMACGATERPFHRAPPPPEW